MWVALPEFREARRWLDDFEYETFAVLVVAVE
jgi:hypothetical protein